MSGLIPARLEYTEGGVPYSGSYQDVYHSTDGGPGQASHVFLAGNRLPEQWRHRDRFTILETGFGTGLNFLTTWTAWQDDPLACRRLHYLAVEKHPFNAGDLALIHAAWPELAARGSALRAAWPCLVPGMHRIGLAGGRVVLTLLLGDAEALLAKLNARVDAFFLDGFAPAKNPDLWAPSLLMGLGRLAAPGATLATWSVSAGVREGLRAAGFMTEKSTGYGRKREMLRGRFEPVNRAACPSPVDPPMSRQAIVIGAGLAGTACCERLADRGWQSILLDQHPGPALEASGNLAGIAMPLLSRDDNIASRLSRAAFLYTMATWARLAAQDTGLRYESCGVLQIARDHGQEKRMRAVVESSGFPADFVRMLTCDQAHALLEHAAPAGGWLFARGGWANPPSLCQAALRTAAESVSTRFNVEVTALRRQDGTWQALGAGNRILAEAPVAILATGAQANPLLQAAPLPIRRVRGQVSHIPAGAIPPLRVVLCREGYATPAVDGLHAVGASYGLEDDCLPRQECDLENLLRLDNLLPGTGTAIAPSGLSSRVGFRPVPPDRLPIVGPLPDWNIVSCRGIASVAGLPRQAGLYGLLGYASRGLIWAAPMAEALVCRLEGEPMPFETDLLAAIDPGRFLLKKLRRSG